MSTGFWQLVCQTQDLYEGLEPLEELRPNLLEELHREEELLRQQASHDQHCSNYEGGGLAQWELARMEGTRKLLMDPEDDAFLRVSDFQACGQDAAALEPDDAVLDGHAELCSWAKDKLLSSAMWAAEDEQEEAEPLEDSNSPVVEEDLFVNYTSSMAKSPAATTTGDATYYLHLPIGETYASNMMPPPSPTADDEWRPSKASHPLGQDEKFRRDLSSYQSGQKKSEAGP